MPQLKMFQDNDACCRICRSGKNPNMQHIGRTHRISIAWLHEQLKESDIHMFRADSELMAADIFTKHFPESKREVWQSNLKLINIFDAKNVLNIDYTQRMVQSLRGDLDAPSHTPIEDIPDDGEGERILNPDDKKALTILDGDGDDDSTVAPDDLHEDDDFATNYDYNKDE